MLAIFFRLKYVDMISVEASVSCGSPAIAETNVLVPCYVVKSLQLILRSGTRRWNLRVPDLQMSCSDWALR